MILATLAAGAAMCVPMTSGPYPASTAVVDAFVAAYNRHDADAIRKLVTADAVVGAPGNMTNGRDMVDAYKRDVFRVYPTIRIEILQRQVVNDLVADLERYTDWPYDDLPTLAVYRIDRGCIVSITINVTEDSDPNE